MRSQHARSPPARDERPLGLRRSFSYFPHCCFPPLFLVFVEIVPTNERSRGCSSSTVVCWRTGRRMSEAGPPLFYDFSQGWPPQYERPENDLRIKPALPEGARVRRPPVHRKVKEPEPLIGLPGTVDGVTTEDALATDRSIKPSLPAAAIVKRRTQSARSHYRPPPPQPPTVDFEAVPFSVWAMDNLWSVGGVRRKTPIDPTKLICMKPPSDEIMKAGPPRGTWCARPLRGPGSGMGERYVGMGGQMPFGNGRFQGHKPGGDPRRSSASSIRPGNYRQPPKLGKSRAHFEEEVRARQREERRQQKRTKELAAARAKANQAERVAAQAQRVAESRSRVVDAMLAEQRKHAVFCVARGISPCPHEGMKHLFDETAAARVVQEAVQAKVFAAEQAEAARIATAELAQLISTHGRPFGGGGEGAEWRSRRIEGGKQAAAEAEEREEREARSQPGRAPVRAGAASLMTADMAAMAHAMSGTEGFEVEADADYLTARGRHLADSSSSQGDEAEGLKQASEAASEDATETTAESATEAAREGEAEVADGVAAVAADRAPPLAAPSRRSSRRSSRKPSRRVSEVSLGLPQNEVPDASGGSSAASSAGLVAAESRPAVESDSEETKAARLLQAHSRGRQARAEVSERRAAAERDAAATRVQAVHRSKKARDAATEKRKEAAKERIRLRDERAAMTMQAHERARQARIEVRMKQSRAQAQAAAAATQGASSKGNPNWREQSTSEVNRLIQQNAEAWRKAESERINAEIARRAEERVKQAEARSKERKAQLAEQRSAEAQHINEQVSTRLGKTRKSE